MRVVPLLLLPAAAYATPVTLTHQGRLLDAQGAPVDGPVTVSVALYDSPSAEEALFEESFSVSAADGFYSVVLGADPDGPALHHAVFDGTARYVGVGVGGVEAPRQLLATVPRAAHALSVSGDVRVADTAAACTDANRGALKYDGELSVCDAEDWQPVAAGDRVEASGGTASVIDVGGQAYRVHRFATVGTSTLTVTRGGTVEVLVVGGGGGGGADLAGGGGAGAVLWVPALTLSPGAWTVVVGAGGAGGGTSREVNTAGQPGRASVFGPLTAPGGGGGAPYWGGDANLQTGGRGGSGGGGGAGTTTTTGAGGLADPGAGLGSAGGRAYGGSPYYGGGGGGAGGQGANATGSSGGAGGPGVVNSITGAALTYGGGGGGSAYGSGSGTAYGAGGDGGGGRGGYGNSTTTGPGVAGTANTGGGGGGGAYQAGPAPGGAGGSGVVIVRYPIFP